MSQRMIGIVFVLLRLGIIVMDTKVSLRCVAAPPEGLNCQAERRILGVWLFRHRHSRPLDAVTR